jgi:hypothetical protein
MNTPTNATMINTHATATTTTTDSSCRPPLARANAMKCNQVQYHQIESLTVPRLFCPLYRDISDLSIESFLMTSSNDDMSKLIDDNTSQQQTRFEHELSKFHLNEDDDLNTDGLNKDDMNETGTIAPTLQKYNPRPFLLDQDIVSAQPLRYCCRRRSSIDDYNNMNSFDHVVPIEENKLSCRTTPRRQHQQQTQTLRDALSYNNMYSTMTNTNSFHKVFCEAQTDTIPTIPRRKSSFYEE